MTQPPMFVLSEQLQQHLAQRRLVSAVFLTYKFEPAFFEQQVLPVFIDVTLSHVDKVRAVQLEDALRALTGSIAVYYDANGLVTGESGSAKLDIARIPVRHRTGVFHPKNVFLLVEDVATDDAPAHQTMIVASMSANLTQAGWWENVEACHIEEIAAGDKSYLRDSLEAFLRGLTRRASAEREHTAVRSMLDFLRKDVASRALKSSEGLLHTHFFAGGMPLVEFLDQSAGTLLKDCYLEVISPYFDDAKDCKPLEELKSRFRPREVRVFLPKADNGDALCRPELYESVRSLDGVSWGRLPADVTRRAKHEDSGLRSVHAKVYRFFSQNPKREIMFVGSANLTTAAHGNGGNLETGFLVDQIPATRPEFWLIADKQRPGEFQVRKEDEGTATSGGTPLNLRYHWDTSVAEAFWDAKGESPRMMLSARGTPVGEVAPLTSQEWTSLGVELALRIRDLLRETSIFEVSVPGQTAAILLVQEEKMEHKPSLLSEFTASDILRYWALLTADQRNAFLESRATELSLVGQGADLIVRLKRDMQSDGLFDRFAGVFHAFGTLERTVNEALAKGREREAISRVFGRKYDSLGALIDRIEEGRESSGDLVHRYVVTLCADQLCRELARNSPDFWASQGEIASLLRQRLTTLTGRLRSDLVGNGDAGMSEFIDWFERWFRPRAQPPSEVVT